MNKPLDKLSKFLSYVLRHEPHAIGLTLDSEGWANIHELITLANTANTPITLEQLYQIVDNSDKKRFTLSDDGLFIRAAQGHSLKSINIQHKESEPPEFLYHGTATRFLDSIKEQGLVAGERQYVHLSDNEQTALEVGKRYGKPVILKIKALQMQQQGSTFFLAENGVWLTNNVPITYISIN